jgi:hypothetical protein
LVPCRIDRHKAKAYLSALSLPGKTRRLLSDRDGRLENRALRRHRQPPHLLCPRLLAQTLKPIFQSHRGLTAIVHHSGRDREVMGLATILGIHRHGRSKHMHHLRRCLVLPGRRSRFLAGLKGHLKRPLGRMHAPLAAIVQSVCPKFKAARLTGQQTKFLLRGGKHRQKKPIARRGSGYLTPGPGCIPHHPILHSHLRGRKGRLAEGNLHR